MFCSYCNLAELQLKTSERIREKNEYTYTYTYTYKEKQRKKKTEKEQKYSTKPNTAHSPEIQPKKLHGKMHEIKWESGSKKAVSTSS